MRQVVAAVYVNLRSYISYISGNRIKTLGIRLLRGFGGFSVPCKGFSSGALLHIRQKDRNPTPNPSPREGRYKPTPALTEKQKDMIPPFISDRRTKGHDTHPFYLTEGQKDIIPPPFGRAGVGFTSPPTPPQGRGV